ncbi:MAG TPA: hypothetical protein VMX54_08490 [Vicinamibacteria bacterium]|nr:hypothetical protein [Vicinamibacteria bacterium]
MIQGRIAESVLGSFYAILAAAVSLPGLPAGWTSQTYADSILILSPGNPPRIALALLPPEQAQGDAKNWFGTRCLALAQPNGGRVLGATEVMARDGLLLRVVQIENANHVKLRDVFYGYPVPGGLSIALLSLPPTVTDRDPLLETANQYVQRLAAQRFEVASSTVPHTPATAAESGPVPNAQPAGGPAKSDETMPVLEYSDPRDFWRGGAGGKRYAEYQGSNINFVLCVYPFREFNGDAQAAFRRTLLSDLVDVLYREQGIAGAPRFGANSMPGADAVFDVHFQDGVQKQHHRILITSGHWVALVDMIAPTAFAWQKGFLPVAEMLKTMHVGRTAAPPSLANGPGPNGARLAGLFQAMKNKFTVNLALGPGYGSPKLALHYYLFSADGRVYRRYDFPPVGSAEAARHFDFDAAERQDPGNGGRFAVRGNELYIRMGGPNADEITTTITDPDSLELDGVRYTRKW